METNGLIAVYDLVTGNVFEFDDWDVANQHILANPHGDLYTLDGYAFIEPEDLPTDHDLLVQSGWCKAAVDNYPAAA